MQKKPITTLVLVRKFKESLRSREEAKYSAKDELQHLLRGLLSPTTGSVTEEEIKALLMQKTHITTQKLVGNFKDRLRTRKDKDAFTEFLRRISKIQTINGSKFVMLK